MSKVSYNPVVSIIVVVYNMRREAARTLYTLTPEYQNVSPGLYEVIVIDNGSEQPLDAEAVGALSGNFRYVCLEKGYASPTYAMNYGVTLAKGIKLGFMIDGARMLSPGVIKNALSVFQTYENPVVSTIGFHLGNKMQQEAVLEGYNQKVEDRLLNSIDWKNDGYDLFSISSFAGSSKFGWFGPPDESNCIFMNRETHNAVGGFDEGFDVPGGGMANLDYYKRVCELPETDLVMLIGEASFHQFHDGAMTSKSSDELHKIAKVIHPQYEEIRGERFMTPLKKYDYYLEHIPSQVFANLHESVKRYLDFREAKPKEEVSFEALQLARRTTVACVSKERTVMILGMHRSGTSALAGSLKEAGLEFGNVVTRSPHNIKGNHENMAIMFMHEDLLEYNGGSWDNPPEVVEWTAVHRAVRDIYLSQYLSNNVFGIKDPRMLFVLDGWLEVLEKPSFVGIFRHPSLVAASIEKRDGFSFDESMEIWRAYNQKLLDMHSIYKFPLVEFCDDADCFRDYIKRVVSDLKLPGESKGMTFFEDDLRNKSVVIKDVPEDILLIYHGLQEQASE